MRTRPGRSVRKSRPSGANERAHGTTSRVASAGDHAHAVLGREGFNGRRATGRRRRVREVRWAAERATRTRRAARQGRPPPGVPTTRMFDFRPASHWCRHGAPAQVMPAARRLQGRGSDIDAPTVSARWPKRARAVRSPIGTLAPCASIRLWAMPVVLACAVMTAHAEPPVALESRRTADRRRGRSRERRGDRAARSRREHQQRHDQSRRRARRRRPVPRGVRRARVPHALGGRRVVQPGGAPGGGTRRDAARTSC